MAPHRGPFFCKVRLMYPTGKSVKSCPAPFAKIFSFAPDPNQFTESHRPVPQRGDRASSRARGGMRWTRQRQAMSGDGRAGHNARELTNGTQTNDAFRGLRSPVVL